MRVAAVLSENFAVKALTDAIKRAFGQAVLAVFNDIGEALEYCSVFKTEITFFDTALCDTEFENVSKLFKDRNPKTDIVFVTGMNEGEFSFSDGSWLLSPLAAEPAKKEPESPDEKWKPDILLYVQCFGNFDVFKTDRTRLNFKRKKSKELFAYLIYRRGAACSNSEVAGILFDDDDYSLKRQQYLQKIISCMTETLAEVGADDVVIRNRGNISVDINRIQCDYYRFIENDGNAQRAWSGEFMTQYSWAEPTAGYISETYEKTN